MQKWLLVLALFLGQNLFAQRGIVFVKKHGYKRVASFAEGAQIRFETKSGFMVDGYISQVRNDSIFVNDMGYHSSEINRIIIREKYKGLFIKILYTTAWVTVVATAVTLTKWTDFKTAFATASVLGYGKLAISEIPHMKRYQYKIGKKFSLQTLDLHF